MKFDPEIVALFEQITSTTDPEETIDFAYSNAERLFREGKYFEAHEVLEFQWKKDFGIRKRFWYQEDISSGNHSTLCFLT